MSSDDARVLGILARLARGAQIEIPLIGDGASDPENRGRFEGTGMLQDGNVTASRSFVVSTEPDPTNPSPCREIGHTLNFSNQVPKLLIQLELWDHCDELQGSLIALRGSGLVAVRTKELVLPAGDCWYRSMDEHTWCLTASPLEPPIPGLGKHGIRVWREANPVVLDTTSLMDWYMLTQDGWERCDRLVYVNGEDRRAKHAAGIEKKNPSSHSANVRKADTYLDNIPSDRTPAPGSPSIALTEQVLYQFKRDGDGWSIRFDRVGGHFELLDGFTYIHQLLVRRRDTGGHCKPIDAIDLVRSLKLCVATATASRSIVEPHEGPLEADRSRITSDAERTFDQRALRKVNEAITERKANIAEIKREIEEADAIGDEPRAERLKRDELDPELRKLKELEQARNRATGLGGKPRRLGTTDVDKARQTVRHAIRAAYERLLSAEPPMTLLVGHLKRSIPPARGGCFIYSPETAVGWRLD